MSIGNLKDTGNMGNNFPYQYKVLSGLQGIIDAITGGGGGGGSNVTIVNPLGQKTMAASLSVVLASNQAGVARTPGFIRATGSGAIGVITYSASVSNVGAANGTFLGVTIKPGETLNFSADAINNYYASGVFTYNGTGTELVIIYNS
jgi:hypothetical protein